MSVPHNPVARVVYLVADEPDPTPAGVARNACQTIAGLAAGIQAIAEVNGGDYAAQNIDRLARLVERIAIVTGDVVLDLERGARTEETTQ